MIPVLFKEDEQVFSHNGIGALYESLSCDVLEEENGAFTMELEYPVDGELFSEIKDFRIIQAKPNDIDEPHNFRIYEIEKSIDELTVYVRANTRTNDLGNNLITNYVGKDITPQQAMNGIKSNLIEPTNFDLISDIQTKSNVEWTRINPLNAIVGVRGSLVDIWGGEIKRTNTAIHLYSRRGRDNVVTIRPGKNIEGLNMTVSTAGLVTKILPTFSYSPVDVPKYQMITNSDGTKEKRRVTASGATTLRDDITVIGNSVSSQYVDNYPTNYWVSVDYGDDDELRDKVDTFIDTKLKHAEESSVIVNMSGFEQELKNFVKTELDKKSKQYFTHRNPGVDKPTVRIKVDMLQLSDSPDWEEFKNLERIGLTDTLDVWVEEYNIDVEVRVTSLTYDSIAEHVIGFNAGSDRAPRQSAVEKKYDDLTKATDDYITSFKNGVQNVMRNTSDGLNRKFEGYTEPPAELSSEGDIWFKEIGEGKVEIWIHDGVYWQPLLTEEFANKVQAEVDAAMLDAEEALLKANEVSDDINTAIQNAGFTSLPEAILEIQGKMDSDRFDQEILDIVGDIQESKDSAAQALTEAQKKVNTIDFDNIVNDIETGVQDAMDEAELATNTLRDSTGQLIKSQDLKVDIDGITSSLTSYAKTTDLNGLATETFVTNKGYQTAAQVSSTLGAYAKTTDLNGLVSQTWVENKGYATASEVSSELSSYAKTSDLTGLATESYVTTRGYQTASQIATTLSAYEKTSTLNTKLAGKANVDDIPSLTGYAKESWVENKSYATAESVTTQLSSYAKTSQLTGLATETFVTNKGYQTAAQVATTLSSYAKSSDLTGLATEKFVTSKGYQTAAQVSTTLKSYAKTTDLSGLATETYVTSRGYQTASQITTTLAAYAKTSQLSGLATETFVTNKGYQTASQVSTTLSSYVKTSTLSGYATVATVNAIKSTADTNKATISTNTGKISTIEQNVSGLQTTVASKAAQSQVTQLATGLQSVVKESSKSIRVVTQSYNTGTANGKPGRGNTYDTDGSQLSVANDRSWMLTVVDRNDNVVFYKTYDIYNSSSTESVALRDKINSYTGGELIVLAGTHHLNNSETIRNVVLDLGGSPEKFDEAVRINSGYIVVGRKGLGRGNGYDRYTPNTNGYLELIVPFKNGTTSLLGDYSFVGSQITQLQNNINLRVQKNDVVNQINISTEGVLIGSAKNKLNITATTTYIANATIKSAHIADLAVTNAKIANGTIASAKIASLDVSKVSGNTTNFVQSAWNNISTQVTIDNLGINMTGSSQWRRTHHNATGFDLYNGSGAYNKAGAIGYFKPTIDVSAASENVILSTRSGIKRHLIGVGVNYTHDFAIGYNPHSDTNRVFIPAVEVRGDSGNIVVHSDIIAGDSGQGWRLDTANHRGNYGARMSWLSNGSSQIHFSNELSIESVQGIQFYTLSGVNKMRIHDNIYAYTDLNMGGKAITNIQTLQFSTSNQIQYGRVDSGTGQPVLDIIGSGTMSFRIGATQNIRTYRYSNGSGGTDIYTNLNMNSNIISNNSDERLKSNIKHTIIDALESISTWQFVDFDWRDSETNRLKGRQYGLIAQNTPELHIYDSAADLWLINSSKQVMMNSHAIQQLASRERNTNLVASQALQATESNEDKIARLERRIEELESVV